MKGLYNAFVHPYLSYSNIIWASTSKSKLSFIHSLQKRAVRIVSYADRKQHSRPLMLNLGILNVYEINIHQIASFMYKVHKKIVPDCLQQHFSPIDHAYPTRHSVASFYENKNCTFLSKFGITYRGPLIWNTLIKSIPNTECSFLTFKNYTKKYLLSTNQTKLWFVI